MRFYIIALGLTALYALNAPVGQPLLVYLAAGVLCMIVAIAVTGTGSKKAIQGS